MPGLINYIKKAFKNYPDTTTRISAENLNHLDDGIYDLDQQLGTSLVAEDDLKFNFSKSGNKYGYKDSNGNFIPFDRVQASKTVTASTSTQTVTPDTGYSGIASVIINPQQHTGTRATVTSNGTIDLGNTHNIRRVPVSVNNTLNLQKLSTTYGNTTLTGLVSGDIIIGWIGWTGGENIGLSNATLLYNGEMGEDMNIWRVNSNSCSTSGVPGSTGIVWFRIYRS